MPKIKFIEDKETDAKRQIEKTYTVHCGRDEIIGCIAYHEDLNKYIYEPDDLARLDSRSLEKISNFLKKLN